MPWLVLFCQSATLAPITLWIIFTARVRVCERTKNCNVASVCRSHLFSHAFMCGSCSSHPLFRINKNGDIFSRACVCVWKTLFPFAGISFLSKSADSIPNQVRFHHSSSSSWIFSHLSSFFHNYFHQLWSTVAPFPIEFGRFNHFRGDGDASIHLLSLISYSPVFYLHGWYFSCHWHRMALLGEP